MYMCVYVHAMKKAELLYNPEGTPLSVLQIQPRHMMEDGKYKGASEGVACRETEKEKKQRVNE